eukprot:306520-Rhodomonas_salina.2
MLSPVKSVSRACPGTSLHTRLRKFLAVLFLAVLSGTDCLLPTQQQPPILRRQTLSVLLGRVEHHVLRLRGGQAEANSSSAQSAAMGSAPNHTVPTHQRIALNEDKLVQLQHIRKGEGDRCPVFSADAFCAARCPPHDVHAYLHYRGFLPFSASPFNNSRLNNSSPLHVVLGYTGDVAFSSLGVDFVGLALRHMAVGDIVRIAAAPQHAFGASGSADGRVPANSTVIYELELLRFGQEEVLDDGEGTVLLSYLTERENPWANKEGGWGGGSGKKRREGEGRRTAMTNKAANIEVEVQVRMRGSYRKGGGRWVVFDEEKGEQTLVLRRREQEEVLGLEMDLKEEEEEEEEAGQKQDGAEEKEEREEEEAAARAEEEAVNNEPGRRGWGEEREEDKCVCPNHEEEEERGQVEEGEEGPGPPPEAAEQRRRREEGKNKGVTLPNRWWEGAEGPRSEHWRYREASDRVPQGL